MTRLALAGPLAALLALYAGTVITSAIERAAYDATHTEQR